MAIANLKKTLAQLRMENAARDPKSASNTALLSPARKTIQKALAQFRMDEAARQQKVRDVTHLLSPARKTIQKALAHVAKALSIPLPD